MKTFKYYIFNNSLSIITKVKIVNEMKLKK